MVRLVRRNGGGMESRFRSLFHFSCLDAYLESGIDSSYKRIVIPLFKEEIAIPLSTLLYKSNLIIFLSSHLFIIDIYY